MGYRPYRTRPRPCSNLMGGILFCGDVSTTPHPHSDSSAKLCELRQCGASRTKHAILACMRSIITIRKRRSPPTPALDRAERLWDAASAVWQHRAITDQLTPAPSVWLIIGVVRKNLPLTSICAELPLSHWSFSEGGEQHRGKGTHKCGSLPVLRGGTRRTWIWACLKYLRFSPESGGQI
ncbi:hypothetical protein B0H14DRAFT_2605381 [Mycena olivaceomarginata]|nr:hypothetical protein B0H14DRAFT_2605381 [Mycena olivaceomarginata]